MTLVRLLLTLLLFPAFVLFVRGIGQRSKALRGASLLFGVVCAGVIINFPGLLDQSARELGINSGGDLALYAVVFSVLSLSGYSLAKFRRLEQRIERLVHELAVQRATSSSEMRHDGADDL